MFRSRRLSGVSLRHRHYNIHEVCVTHIIAYLIFRKGLLVVDWPARDWPVPPGFCHGFTEPNIISICLNVWPKLARICVERTYYSFDS